MFLYARNIPQKKVKITVQSSESDVYTCLFIFITEETFLYFETIGPQPWNSCYHIVMLRV